MNDVRPVVLVTRATGPGQGAVRALLEHGHFAVRALTRDPLSDRARALAAAGARPVRGDLGDLVSLTHAMAGCCAVAAVLAHHDDPDALRRLIDAAADAGVAHVLVAAHVPADAALHGCADYARELGMSLTTVAHEAAGDLAAATATRLGFPSRPIPAS